MVADNCEYCSSQLPPKRRSDTRFCSTNCSNRTRHGTDPWSIITPWTATDLAFLIEQYPKIGQKATAAALGRTPTMIRAKAHRLGLKQDPNGEFRKDWLIRAAASKVGKKRPAQAEVIKRLFAEGKMNRTPEWNRKLGLAVSESHRKNGHPRGALGMKHTAATLAIL